MAGVIAQIRSRPMARDVLRSMAVRSLSSMVGLGMGKSVQGFAAELFTIPDQAFGTY